MENDDDLVDLGPVIDRPGAGCLRALILIGVILIVVVAIAWRASQ